MNNLSDLQQLLPQLNQSEKRYFKIYAARHILGNENAYMELYRLLEKGKCRKMEELRQKLGWPQKKVRMAGGYLYQLLLRSLRTYQQEKSRSIRVHDLQDQAKILAGKGLFDQAVRRLEKARKLTLKTGDEAQLLVILQQESDLQRAQGQEVTLQADQASCIARLAETSAYEIAYARILAAIRRGESQVPAHPQASAPPAQSFFARLYQLAAQAILAHAHEQLPEAEAHYGAIVQHWEAHPHICAQHPDRYQAALSNYLGICCQLQRRVTVTALLPKCQLVPGSTRRQQWDHFRKVLVPQLSFHLYGAEFEAAAALLPTIAAGMQQFAQEMSPSLALSLHHNIAVLHFLRGQAADALPWVQSIGDIPNKSQRVDIRDFARLFELLLHLELGNLRLLPYLLRNARRHLRGRQRLSPFACTLLNFVRSMLAAVDHRDEAAAYAALLAALAQVDESAAVLGLGECRLWAEGKVTALPPVELARRALSG